MPLGATVGRPPSQLEGWYLCRKDSWGMGFLKRGTLSSEMNQKMRECEGTVGEAVMGRRGSERDESSFSPTALHAASHFMGCGLHPWGRCCLQEVGGFLASQPCQKHVWATRELWLRSLPLAPYQLLGSGPRQPQTRGPFASCIKARSWRQKLVFFLAVLCGQRSGIWG